MTCELLTFSPEPVAESLPTSSSAIPQSSLLSGMPTPAQCCESDFQACESSKAMCDPWTSRESWLASMQSALASLVRTFPQPEKAQASTASEAASTERSCEQLTLFDLPGSSSKTPHSSAPEAGISSSQTWWRVDTPGAMDSLPRLKLALRTSAIGGGVLQGVPTVTVNGNYNRKGASPTSGGGLATWVRKYPTPTARDWKSGSKGKKGNSRPLSEEVGGALNPQWVEWLQGWPIGHTESSVWATAKSRCKPQPRGSRSAGRGKE